MVSCKSCWLILLICTLCATPGQAQYSRYLVRLRDKQGTPYNISNPQAFLSARALDRRQRYQLPVDETDLPIPPAYLDSIRLAGNVEILNVSKWLNQVCIRTTDAAALARISAFPFVLTTSGIAARVNPATRPVNKRLDAAVPGTEPYPNTPQGNADYYSYGAAYDQVHLHNGEFLHNWGFRGQGMQVAVLDAGFRNYLSLPTFDSLRNSGRLLETWDFVDQQASVDEDDAHGMKCLSTMAAHLPGSFVGTSPEAAFRLYRTEDALTEYPVEEQYWAAAAERADSLGIDLLSTSLGYTTFDYPLFDHTYSELDGNSTLIARAANLAAKKGMLVVAAAGNDGNSSWHYIATPGDADSALTIGAVSINRVPAPFSSYGPSSDGQIKPDLAAVGVNAIVAGTNTGQPVGGNGTSYATPILAGLTTCLWQAFPELSNLQVMEALRRSSDRYQQPDDRTGYGIPDLKKAFVQVLLNRHQMSAGIENCVARLQLSLKAAAGMQVALERKLPSDSAYQLLSLRDFSGGFSTRAFSLQDNLSDFTGGIPVQYRVKMILGSDTSFYVDSVLLQYQQACAPLSERKICAGGATYFSVENPAPGTSFRWELNSGSGFSPLSDDSRYSGTASAVLILRNAPDSWYGYQYRCRLQQGASTQYSPALTLRFASLWTGVYSTAWEDGRNWSCGNVPTGGVEVTVEGEAPLFPVISTSAACRSLTTAPTASVTVKTGASLQIAGH